MPELEPTVCPSHRSAVPDLLFEDVQVARVGDIRPYLEQPQLIAADARLHRLTVFLTYRCDLRCVYCKTIARTAEELRMFPQKAVTFTYDRFRAMVDAIATPIEHLHFTGGEAMLVRDLPLMVRYARAIGIRHISITSNGTRPWPAFEALVRSGVTEVRISIDAREPLMGASLSGRAESWDASVQTIRSLASMRDGGAPLFLIANTVISHANRAEMSAIVRFLIGLGVDDVKLITVVDEKLTLGRFADAAVVSSEVRDLLLGHPESAFPLLRRKLQTVFSEQAIGLEDVPRPDPDWRCYIPLTERTVDGVYHYPCSVYLREGGTPLGRIDDPPEVQRANTVRFVRDGQCLDDTICRQYCLHCTRAFNVAANDARRAMETAPVASSTGV